MVIKWLFQSSSGVLLDGSGSSGVRERVPLFSVGGLIPATKE